jgi:hypothetical protein
VFIDSISGCWYHLMNSTSPVGLTVNSGAAQELAEKRPQAATCQQSFVKLGLMTCPSGCQTPQPKWRLAARSPKHGGVGGDRATFYYDAVGKEVHSLRSCVVLSAIWPLRIYRGVALSRADRDNSKQMLTNWN